MGLDCSHDAWQGAYSAFNAFRQVVCKAFGGSFPPHNFPGFRNGTIRRKDLTGEAEPLDNNLIYFQDPDPDEKADDVNVPDGLYEFLTHSDCDGEISPEMCAKVADDLEAILPKIRAMTGTPWSGHVEYYGGYAAVTERFIAGCRAAHKAGEPLEFY